MTVVELRRFEPADAGHVWALSRVSNIGHTADPSAPLPLPPLDEPPAQFPGLADIEASFIRPGGEFLVGHLDGAPVAIGGMWPTGDGRAEVKHVRIHPAIRRRGIGRRLMGALEETALASGFRELHLDTAHNQPEAIDFYVALGYVEVGRETRPEWAWTNVYFAKAF